MPEKQERLIELLSLWERRRAAGQAVGAAELCAMDPELLPEVEAEIAALCAFDGLATHADDAGSLGDSEPPMIPGYQILDVLGSGGMGVVYRARQVSLGRTVALKMLRASRATPDELARFRTEAEALGRLQHPNIVQVFEVGVAGDKPYIVLEYVPGGSLAELLNKPLPVRLAAELVRTLAQAAQVAHSAGIVHRDLKPANVLLQRTNHRGTEWTEEKNDDSCRYSSVPSVTLWVDSAVAKITDFGLAKRLGSDQGHTLSGAILGTPSYMAPEQASGRVGAIGPGTDVYALGAILYECLSGRPPFQSPDVWNTIQQVIQNDPVPLRDLQPMVPLDMDTIALKCLEKDLRNRYATAQDLADELGRFLRDEPILARPIPWSEKTRRWIRRNPAVATAAFSTVLAVALAFAFVTWQWRKTAAAQRGAALAHADALFTTPAESVPLVLQHLGPARGELLPHFRQLVATGDSPQVRLRAAFALTSLGDHQTDFLLDAIASAIPREAENFIAALGQDLEVALAGLGERARSARDPNERARCAILALHLGDPAPARELCAPGPHPAGRTAFIHSYPRWHGSLTDFPEILRLEKTPELQYALCAAAGQVPSDSWKPSVRRHMVKVLQGLHRNAIDAGVHAAADWTLRQFEEVVPTPPPADPDRARRWSVSPQGMTFVRIDPGSFTRDPARPGEVVRITRPFWMANRETAWTLFRLFLDDPGWPAGDRPADTRGISNKHGLPVHACRWDDALLFCNWLSHQNGRTPCYRRTGRTESIAMISDRDTMVREPMDVWACDFTANGYRLPTDGEWELACRAGTATRYFFGEDEDRLVDYDIFLFNSRGQMPRGDERIPNPLGLFSMAGGVQEWCWDRYRDTPAHGVDPTGPETGNNRTVRAGSWVSQARGCTSLFRSYHPPVGVRTGLGFRIVHTE